MSTLSWTFSIGKILKANYINILREISSKTHDLIYLVNKIGLNTDNEFYETLEKANNYHLEARYPDEKLNFYKLCTKEFTEPRFIQIIEAFKWLKSQMK